MKTTALLTLAAVLAGAVLAAPVVAQQRDQDVAFELRGTGRLLPVREIESRIVPLMGDMTYMGFEFSGRTSTYRLKFMDGRRMVWVDVDGRTGRIVGRS